MVMKQLKWILGGAVVISFLSIGGLTFSSSEFDACGVDIRDQFLRLSRTESVSQAELESQFGFCRGSNHKQSASRGMQDEDVTEVKLSAFPSNNNTYVGSPFYEEIGSCGYEPQKALLACTVEIKQTFGFGGSPGNSGSDQWIQFCADFEDGSGLVSISLESVHVHDGPVGGHPRRRFFAIITTAQELSALPLNGQSISARAVLAWSQVPDACDFEPVWGNWTDFQIRLDP